MKNKYEGVNLDDVLNDKQRSALKLLRESGIFYNDNISELDAGDDPQSIRLINLNDTFWWGTAYCQFLPDDKIEELSNLFFKYGWCGVLYWCSKQEEIKPEFENVIRSIQFVENEELIFTKEGKQVLVFRRAL